MKKFLSLFAICFIFLACHTAQAQLKEFLEQFEPIATNAMEAKNVLEIIGNKSSVSQDFWAFMYGSDWRTNDFNKTIEYLYPVGKIAHNTTQTTVICLEVRGYTAYDGKKAYSHALVMFCMDSAQNKRVVNRQGVVDMGDTNINQRLGKYSFVSDENSNTFYFIEAQDNDSPKIRTLTLIADKHFYKG
jgi:hypothetical protein